MAKFDPKAKAKRQKIIAAVIGGAFVVVLICRRRVHEPMIAEVAARRQGRPRRRLRRLRRSGPAGAGCRHARRCGLFLRRLPELVDSDPVPSRRRASSCPSTVSRARIRSRSRPTGAAAAPAEGRPPCPRRVPRPPQPAARAPRIPRATCDRAGTRHRAPQLAAGPSRPLQSSRSTATRTRPSRWARPSRRPTGLPARLAHGDRVKIGIAGGSYATALRRSR